MMSLLSVTVKKARYVGAQAAQFNTYVTLKLQNVKSTTVTVKGPQPCWEQDFLFETNDVNTGLLIEVWSKGMIWDRAMGYHWLPLQTVQYSNEEGTGQWLSLDAELVMRDGEVVGTKTPTGYSLLVDCRFELPFDPENIEQADLQRKLEMLNTILDQEARVEQARRQMQYTGHSGYSEDSDYTSDLNYPVGQHPNSSASQFRAAAHQLHTPQRSLETSRENSYERDDAGAGSGVYLSAQAPNVYQNHLSPGSHRRNHQRFSPNNVDDFSYGSSTTTQQYPENTMDPEPLFYNSRPRSKQEFSSRRRKYQMDSLESQEAWVSCESSFYDHSVESMDVGYSAETEYYGSQPSTKKALRRPSLERQTTLYDDYYSDTANPFYSTAGEVAQVNYLASSTPYNLPNQQPPQEIFYDSLSYPCQDDSTTLPRYRQGDEHRQWDSGGYHSTTGYDLNAQGYESKTGYDPTKGYDLTTGYNSYIKNSTSELFGMSGTGRLSGKKLPSVPAVAKRRSSISAMDEGYMGYEDSYNRTLAPTPLGKRKMPQIPTKRSTSRQSSVTDGTGRGASLPPTPTKSSSKILTKLQAPGREHKSLPTTPGRQLPKPNHHSAKMKRGNRMKRTSSEEYGDQNDSLYVRPGALSAQNYNNEDNYYNYWCYNSTEDHLAEENNLTPVAMSVTSVTGVTSVTDNRTFKPSINNAYSNYYGNAQVTDNTYYGGNYYAKQLTGQVIQPSTDSVTYGQNNDYEQLQDGYGPAQNGYEQFQSNYDQKSNGYGQIQGSYVQDNSSSYGQEVSYGSGYGPGNSYDIKVSGSDNGQLYQGDQSLATTQLKAIHKDAAPSVTVAQVHNQNSFRQNKGMLKQDSIDITQQQPYLAKQDSLDTYNDYQPSAYQQPSNDYQQNSVAVSNYQQNKIGYQQNDTTYQQKGSIGNTRTTLREQFSEYSQEEPFLEAQESIESYVEDDALQDDLSQDYYPTKPQLPNNQLQTHVESPSVDIYGEDEGGGLRRGSSQITVVDPYHPSLQQPTTGAQNHVTDRRTSEGSFTGTPSRKPSSDAYANYQNEQQPEYASRKQSMEVPGGIPRRSSIRHTSPTITVAPSLDYHDNIPEEHLIIEEHPQPIPFLPEEGAKTDKVTFEIGEVEKPQRSQVTAQQRWLWAYNKIIMQLNVSVLLKFLNLTV